MDDDTSTLESIALAVHDGLALDEVADRLTSSTTADLNPLDVIPLLLPRRDRAAQEILAFVGEQCNPKEVVIAVQAAVERLESIVLDGDDSGDDDDDEDNLSTPPSQLITLIALYSSVIPRLKIHKKPPSDTLQPLLSQLESTITIVSTQASRDEGRQTIRCVAQLIQSSLSWVKASTDVSGCTDMLYSLIDSTLTVCSSSINSSLAQRTFEDCFPRLTFRSSVPLGWEEGEKVVSSALDAFTALDLTLDYAISHPTFASLILLAHSPSLPPPHTLLPALLGTILASLRTNTALDESFSVLLRTLTDAKTESPKRELGEDIVTPLLIVLPSIASQHPDPQIRHQAFRIISLLLSLTPPTLRLHILTDLASESSPPAMCAAAVGLIRETILETLSENPIPTTIFTSPLVFKTLGPVLFLPRPHDLFSSTSVSDWEESQEPRRIVECLSLYYVLLSRDKQNLTGVHDTDMVSSIEKTLLGPLRSYLATNGVKEQGSVLVSLQIGLERVDSVLSTKWTGCN